nr:hypothetical protein [Bacilli bacterium]
MTNFTISVTDIESGEDVLIEEKYTSNESRAEEIAQEFVEKYGKTYYVITVTWHRDRDGMNGYLNPNGADFNPEDWNA